MATRNTISALSLQHNQAFSAVTPSGWELLPAREIYFDENGPKIRGDIDAITDSLLERGFEAPLTVRRADPTTTNKHYEIIDGKARWICALALGIKTVPAIVVHMSDIEVRVHRERLDREELAQRLFAEGLDHPDYLM